MSNKIKFSKPYAGKVVNYTYDEQNQELVLEIKLMNDEDTIFKVSKMVDFSEDSEFISFCAHMSLYDYQETNIDFNEFIDLPIICTLYEDASGKVKIDFIDFFWECYADREEYQEFFKLTDEEMEDYFYGDIFNLYGIADMANNKRNSSEEDSVMKFKKIDVEEGVTYGGNIVSYSIDDNKRFFRVYVEPDGIEGITFMKCIRYAEYTPSLLSEFCEIMDIIDSKGNVDFDELIGTEVLFTLNQGKDNNYYISDIYPEGDDDVEE